MVKQSIRKVNANIMNSANERISGNMRRLLVLATVVLLAEGAALRVPKIYNALISSDENLTPSHAYPVLEPVLRTTALGVAFPPIIVHPPTPKENKKEDDIGDAKVTGFEVGKRFCKTLSTPAVSVVKYVKLHFESMQDLRKLLICHCNGSFKTSHPNF